MKAGKATHPSEGVCGKEKEVDAGLDFAAYLCMGRSPCGAAQERKGTEQEGSEVRSVLRSSLWLSLVLKKSLVSQECLRT